MSNVPPNVPGHSDTPLSSSAGVSGGLVSGGLQSGTPPPAKSGGLFTARNIIIGLVALAVLCVCGCVGVLAITGGSIGTIFSQVAAPAAVGTEFMTDLQKGDWAKAYGLCAPALQSEFGSAANLGKRITDGKAQPTDFSFTNTNLNSDRLDLSGTANFVGGGSGTISLVITKDGNDWKIAGFNLQPK